MRQPIGHPQAPHPEPEPLMQQELIAYYEAIERASAEMLNAAREGNWDEVVKIEGACAVLISQLKNAAQDQPLPAQAAKRKSRIMQRILLNDAEIRHLVEPWLEDVDDLLTGQRRLVH